MNDVIDVRRKAPSLHYKLLQHGLIYDLKTIRQKHPSILPSFLPSVAGRLLLGKRILLTKYARVRP